MTEPAYDVQRQAMVWRHKEFVSREKTVGQFCDLVMPLRYTLVTDTEQKFAVRHTPSLRGLAIVDFGNLLALQRKVGKKPTTKHPE
jgi:hypothetical protein